MNAKPTYQELEQKIHNLERSISECDFFRTESIFKIIAEHSSSLIAVIDDNAVYTYVNPAVYKIGYNPEELIGRSGFDLIHPEDIESLLGILKKGQQGKISTIRASYRVISKSGRIYHMEGTFDGISDEKGGLKRVVSITDDVTEQKIIEQNLQKSEKESRLITQSVTHDVLDSAAVGLFVLDSDFRIMQANKSLVDFFCFSKKKYMYKDIRRFLYEQVPDILDNADLFIRDLISSYDEKTFLNCLECRVLASQGRREERWLEYRSSPIRSGLYAGGRIEHFTDITERKNVELALQESEGKYRRLTERVNDVLFSMDLDFNLSFVAPSVKRLLGYTAEEVQELAAKDLLAPDSLNRARADFYKLTKTEKQGEKITEPYVSEWQFYTKEGATAWGEVSLAWLRNEEGKVEGMTGIGRNISERKKNEQAFIRNLCLKAMTDLSSGVAHDIDNALTAIFGNVELASNESDLSEHMHEIINNIKSATGMAGASVQRLRGFSDIDILPEDWEAVSINKTLEDVVSLIKPFMQDVTNDIEGKISINTEYSVTPKVLCSSFEISNVFFNLIRNSIEAMPHGGTITIKTQTTDKGCSVTVSDTGTGMDEERRLRVFEPLFTSKGFQPGRGLGMSQVNTIISEYGGNIDIRSTPGKGTSVEIVLPTYKRS